MPDRIDNTHPPTGVFANAFRILTVNNRCHLDFLVFSASEERAYVVARFEVAPSHLQAIQQQTRTALDSGTTEIIHL